MKPKVSDFAKKIAKRLLDIELSVVFVKGGYNMVVAQFGSNTLTFNVSRLKNGFFENPLSVEVIDLLLHELGHYGGMHTEEAYHSLITKMAGKLVMIALKEPEFFEV